MAEGISLPAAIGYEVGRRTRNIKERDVVIISDNVSKPRSQWRLNRIENLYQSEDGLVQKNDQYINRSFDFRR